MMPKATDKVGPTKVPPARIDHFRESSEFLSVITKGRYRSQTANEKITVNLAMKRNELKEPAPWTKPGNELKAATESAQAMNQMAIRIENAIPPSSFHTAPSL
jgi:hypothetical protein